MIGIDQQGLRMIFEIKKTTIIFICVMDIESDRLGHDSKHQYDHAVTGDIIVVNITTVLSIGLKNEYIRKMDKIIAIVDGTVVAVIDFKNNIKIDTNNIILSDTEVIVLISFDLPFTYK